MQAQIDQFFNQMFEQFRGDPQFNALQESPGYSLSLDVRNLKRRYEVKVFLPAPPGAWGKRGTAEGGQAA